MKNRGLFYFFLFLGLLVVAGLIYISVTAAPPSDLQVSFINVGQGDAALIRDPSGFDVLIDGGKTSAGPTVVAYLREQGVDDIDVMVASHADSDHIGGLLDVLAANDIPILEVLYNGYPGDTLTWSNFATAVADEGLTLTAAQFPATFTWGSATAHILNPIPGLANPDQNDVSVVVLLDQGDIEYLFTGDIDTTVEATIVARGTPVAAEILKVSHHGSKYASSAGFLSQVQPEEAVISVGSNPYGHPTNETLARLLAAGARIWRTDESGTVVVTSDGATYTIVGEISLGSTDLFLPLIIRSWPPPTPTPTATYTNTPTNTEVPPEDTPTPTYTPTFTPTATEEAPVDTGNVDIITIFYDGAGSSEPDEYVEIKNVDSKTIQLANWTLSDAANHVFVFPGFQIQPNQTCRVYTNENHPEWCGFNYGSGSAIWNNSGDTATLRDGNGTVIDTYTYP